VIIRFNIYVFYIIITPVPTKLCMLHVPEKWVFLIQKLYVSHDQGSLLKNVRKLCLVKCCRL